MAIAGFLVDPFDSGKTPLWIECNKALGCLLGRLRCVKLESDRNFDLGGA